MPQPCIWTFRWFRFPVTLDLLAFFSEAESVSHPPQMVALYGLCLSSTVWAKRKRNSLGAMRNSSLCDVKEKQIIIAAAGEPIFFHKPQYLGLHLPKQPESFVQCYVQYFSQKNKEWLEHTEITMLWEGFVGQSVTWTECAASITDDLQKHCVSRCLCQMMWFGYLILWNIQYFNGIQIKNP